MKKTGIGMLILLLGVSSWYVWFKKYDYEITFRAHLAPLGAYYKIKNMQYNDSLIVANANIEEVTLQQKVKIAGENIRLDWYFTRIEDTVTEIKVGIVSAQHSLKNRIDVLTGSSLVITQIKANMITIRKKLRYYTDTFKVIVEGESNMPKVQALALSTATKRENKAEQMMKSNGYLHPKLIEHKIQKDGYPFVNVKHWDIENDSIHMDFGFPIVIKDSLPVDSRIVFTRSNAQKALKAKYYGNYRTSDEAWFVILAYATFHGIPIKNEPIEFFFNNPMQGGDELQWKAEVYFPIEE
ncbi:hypothetical protein J8281_05840 [Aquimarina sp. U1-2]|uniref:hypothetical protein n=1 Tax=Aquimarina sp. U1-2 TaxID=2823141 RepID=UPI001AECEDDE|nr:hypothetical protein [Aquimarina sp. U1-2]MBP2831705.1 hypothetical protein [Aquimarina sp. U1-2]